MAETTEIRRVALVGGGVIGSGWAARCLAHGLDVVATDPGPGAEEKIRAGVANAWPALTKVGLKPGASQERLSFAKSLEAAVAEADFVQESAPGERRSEAQAPCPHRRRGQARGRHRVQLLRPAAEQFPGRLQASRAGAGGPSLQSRLHAAAGRSARRQEDLGSIHRYGDRLLQAHRHAPAEGPGRGSRLYRRPAAGGALARGAASDRRRGLHHRRHRRCDPLRPRPALVLLRHLPDLSPGRRRRGHGAFHGPFRPGPGAALDQPQGPRS